MRYFIPLFIASIIACDPPSTAPPKPIKTLGATPTVPVRDPAVPVVTPNTPVAPVHIPLAISTDAEGHIKLLGTSSSGRKVDVVYLNQRIFLQSLPSLSPTLTPADRASLQAYAAGLPPLPPTPAPAPSRPGPGTKASPTKAKTVSN